MRASGKTAISKAVLPQSIVERCEKDPVDGYLTQNDMIDSMKSRRAPISKSTLLILPIVLFLMVFFVVPYVVILFLSFSKEDTTGLTLANYSKVLSDVYYFKILLNTFLLGIGVTSLSLVLGYPCGYFIAKTKSSFKGFFMFLVISPLLVSVIIRSYGWMIILGKTGLINTFLMGIGLIDEPLKLMYNWTGVVIGMTQVLLPFMILSIASVIENIGEELTDMSDILGATKFQTFMKIILPLTLDGIASGCIIVFMLTIGSFVTVMLLGGSTMVMSLLIYQEVLNIMDFNLASTIGTVLLGTSLIFLYAQVKLIKRKGTESLAKV